MSERIKADSAQPADSGRVDANCMDVLRRLRDMLPTVGICGWPAGVSALDEAISTLAAQGQGESFQQRVSAWMAQCFLPSLYSNMTERGDRLLEEVLELLQSNGYDRTRVATLVDYVWSRPVGEPSQEVGGVMVTLAGFCWIAGLDMHAAGDIELTRIERPEVMDKIRHKQEAKNALPFDTPLPGNAPASPVGVPDGADCCVHGCHCGCCQACKSGSCEPVKYAACDCIAAAPSAPESNT